MFCAQDMATGKDAVYGARYIFVSILDQQILHHTAMPQAVGKRSTVFDPESNFTGFILTKRGVARANFVQFNKLS